MPDGSAYKKNTTGASKPPSSGAQSGQSGGTTGGSGGGSGGAPSNTPAQQSSSSGSSGGSGSGASTHAPAQKAGSAGGGGGSGSGTASHPPAQKQGSSGSGSGSGGGPGTTNHAPAQKAGATGSGGGSGSSTHPPSATGKSGNANPQGQAAQKAHGTSTKTGKAAEELQGAGPVGQGDYEVGPGECMSSIALDKGYYWRTIWDHPPNSELKSIRKDPNVLMPKDLVTLPQKREKQESGATEMRHRFVRRGEPSRFRFQAKVEDEPLRNSPYVLTVDGKKQEGVTDAEGWIEVELPGNAHSGELVITCEGQEYRFMLNLGQMEPISEVIGVQKRLKNLGFPPGPIDGKMGPKTRSAIAQFQKSQSMEATGELDEATRQKLQKAHGC